MLTTTVSNWHTLRDKTNGSAFHVMWISFHQHRIPHDIKTMHELWGVKTYRKQNAYLSTACLMDLVLALPDGPDKTELVETQNRLLKAYDEMANYYHTEKANNPENSLVLG